MAKRTPAAVEGTTRVVGLLGHPVDHSLSPRMHNAAYAALGIDFVYVPFRATPATVRQAVKAMRTLGIAGFNVTVPYKQEMLRLVDRLSPTAAAIGAVNTVWRDGDALVGHNTDAEGFARALASHGAPVQGARVLVIGAGGSARAILHALREGGAAHVVLANRTTRTAVALAREFNPPAERRPAPRSARGPSRGALAAANASSSLIVAAGLDALADRALLATRTLVVNCTPVGLHGGDFLDYDAAATAPGCVHFDLAYGRKATPFLALAARARRPTVDGRHMLVHQGAAAFALFTGSEAPVPVMLEACGVAAPRKGKGAATSRGRNGGGAPSASRKRSATPRRASGRATDARPRSKARPLAKKRAAKKPSAAKKPAGKPANASSTKGKRSAGLAASKPAQARSTAKKPPRRPRR